jgi:outer membrane protein TolC
MKLLRVGLAVFIAGTAIHAQAQVSSMSQEQPESSRPAGTATPSSGAEVAGGGGQGVFLGSVPAGTATSGILPLSLKAAIDRGLKYNLGLLLADQGTRAARGARLRALSDLLPKLTWQTSETREQINLKAFGFPLPSGFPAIVGPFNVFDTRAFLSQSVLDLKALHSARAESENLKAAEYSYQESRNLVVLVCADLYLQAIAGASRVEAAGAELNTAQAVYDQAGDLRKAGVVPGIDVLRAQVQLQAQQQRSIFFKNEFQKQKLDLARVIGLPIGQQFELTDQIPYAPVRAMVLEEALERAFRSRADYQSAVALVHAAESNKRAARGEGLPTFRVSADYGDIGLAPNASHGTFSVAGNLRIPIFQGGLVRGKVLEADALLEQRKAELENLRGRIDYEVRTAFMDVRASGDQVQVAISAAGLAKAQVKQAQDRFAAGVANSLEVVQAQEALATADENYISSLFNFNVARATLARAAGVAEQAVKDFLGGSQ